MMAAKMVPLALLPVLSAVSAAATASQKPNFVVFFGGASPNEQQLLSLPGQTWLQPASSHHAARSDLTALAGNLAPALQTTGDGATWARTTRRRVASPPTSTSSLRKG